MDERTARPESPGADAGLSVHDIARERKRRRPGRDEALDALIEKQSRLFDIQIANLMEDRALEHRHLALRFFGDRLRIGLQLLGIAFGAVVLIGFSAMVWRAHEVHGLVVEAFQTPADVAGRGFTGVVAAHLVVDRMNDLVSSADLSSLRAAKNITGDWGDDIKVEIPETGVSISELERLLRQWFGHETIVTGEVYSPGQGYVVRLRAGSAAPVLASGNGPVDQMVTQAADQLFAQTQPYRYAIWLETQHRMADAEKVFASTAKTGSTEERAWAYEGWGGLLTSEGDNRGAIAKDQQALSLEPLLASAYPSVPQWLLGHSQAALDEARKGARASRSSLSQDYSAMGVVFEGLGSKAVEQDLTGDVQGEYATQRGFIPIQDFLGNLDLVSADLAMLQARMHDVSGSLQTLSHAPAATDGYVIAKSSVQGPYLPHFEGFAAIDDWPDAVTDLEAADAAAHAAGNSEDVRRTYLWPLLAYAYQKVGRAAEADGLVAQTPLDCDLCLRMRGRIAAEWGEALLAKGDFDGAVAKFAAADPFAPRWGRNHMIWGEALAKLGRGDEGRAQYRAAAGMDLSAPDRARLAVLLGRG
jgi:tetratricopeptide (TPR) repeat protein